MSRGQRCPDAPITKLRKGASPRGRKARPRVPSLGVRGGCPLMRMPSKEDALKGGCPQRRMPAKADARKGGWKRPRRPAQRPEPPGRHSKFRRVCWRVSGSCSGFPFLFWVSCVFTDVHSCVLSLRYVQGHRELRSCSVCFAVVNCRFSFVSTVFVPLTGSGHAAAAAATKEGTITKRSMGPKGPVQGSEGLSAAPVQRPGCGRRTSIRLSPKGAKAP